MNINEQFLQTVRRRHLLDNNNRVIVAFSGGADSCVLLQLLDKNKRILGAEIIGIAHVDHGLRGDASTHDMQFCKSVAESYNLPFFLKTAKQERDSDGNPIGSEAWGRNIRRSFFEKLHNEHNVLIATGHNAGDVAETVLLRMIRGTASAGMHGIKAKNDYYIRPIIDCSREEIRDYALQSGINYCDDITNDENDYSRNVIRNKVLPILNELNPSCERAIIRAAGSTELAHNLVRSLAEDFLSRFTPPDLKEYDKLHKAVQLEVCAIIISQYREPTNDMVQKARLVLKKRLIGLELKKGVQLKRQDGKAVIIYDNTT